MQSPKKNLTPTEPPLSTTTTTSATNSPITIDTKEQEITRTTFIGNQEHDKEKPTLTSEKNYNAPRTFMQRFAEKGKIVKSIFGCTNTCLGRSTQEDFLRFQYTHASDQVHSCNQVVGEEIEFLNPQVFCSNVDVINRLQRPKVAVIDGGCIGTLSDADINCFQNIKIDEVTHSKRSCSSRATLSPHGFGCAYIIGGKRKQVNFFDVVETEIQGIVPNACIYAYPVGCEGCNRTPQLVIEAIEKARKAGVKVLSMSIGRSVEVVHKFQRLTDDVVSMKLLDAVEEMLAFVTIGNDGPLKESCKRGSPWCVTAAACTTGEVLETDIEIATDVDVPSLEILNKFHQGEKELNVIHKFKGNSLNVFTSPFLKLIIDREYDVLDKDCFLQASEIIGQCLLLPAKPSLSTIVVGSTVSSLSKVSLRRDDVNVLCHYHKEFRGHIFARILRSKFRKDSRGVVVSNFSSKGPSRICRENITPDLIAPGYAILSAHPTTVALNLKKCTPPPAHEWGASIDLRKNIELESELYNSSILGSGTSFACPQIAAAALIISCTHPKWTPMEVKSSLVTTATSFAARRIPGDEFAFGAGSVNLDAALDPGLVYNETRAHFREYVEKTRSIYDLNLPTFAASFSYSHESCTRIFRRKLRNVGGRYMSYTCKIRYFSTLLDPKIEVNAVPDRLEFKRGDVKEFKLIVKVVPRPSAHVSALVMWIPDDKDGQAVCSPLHLYHQSGFDHLTWYKKEASYL